MYSIVSALCIAGLVPVAIAEGNSGAPRFLQKAKGVGEQCESSLSPGYFTGGCQSGLICVPSSSNSTGNTSSVCRKVCGHFGELGLLTTNTCSAGNTCVGFTSVPCREWANECLMYCDDTSSKPLHQEGDECGTSGSTGHYYGDCADGLECVWSGSRFLLGAKSTCKRVKKQAGEPCGFSSSTGHYHGFCDSNLVCATSANASILQGAGTCRQVCGHFGGDGSTINGTCGAETECVGSTSVPCREWANECLLYCDAAATSSPLRKEHEQCGTSGSTGVFYGDCGSDLKCVPLGAYPGAPSSCQKLGKQLGEACVSSNATANISGDCQGNLVCVPPSNSQSGAPSTCHEVCGSFGPHGEETSSCGGNRKCVGRLATPCRPWAKECTMFCDVAPTPRKFLQKGERCGMSVSTGYFYGDCASGLVCALPATGAFFGAASVCQQPQGMGWLLYP